jgi:hypothetical protein
VTPGDRIEKRRPREPTRKQPRVLLPSSARPKLPSAVRAQPDEIDIVRGVYFPVLATRCMPAAPVGESRTRLGRASILARDLTVESATCSAIAPQPECLTRPAGGRRNTLLDQLVNVEMADFHSRHSVAASLSHPWRVLARVRLLFAQPVVPATNFAQSGANAAANTPSAQCPVRHSG